LIQFESEFRPTLRVNFSENRLPSPIAVEDRLFGIVR